jgi:two-component system cell cycle sensor histidine kinase/response regulator CckA
MPSGGKLRIVTENMPAATGASEGRSAAAEQPGGDTVALTVSDTGLGMDKETLSRIFEPFFTTKEEGRGTGLGLSTAYGVVQQSGGTITCASTPSAGTSFRISFPRTEGREEAPADVGGRAGVWTGRGTILVAEDEPAVRAFVVATLTRAGYTVQQAEDGEEALKLLVSSPERIDLLISDVVMPRLGGKELSLRAREVSPGSRILFISGYIGDAVAERGSAEDRIRVLRKPFGPRELLAEVRSILNGS